MRSLNEFFMELRRLDVKLWAEGGRLRYNAPKGVMNPELLEELKTRKAEVLAFLIDAENVLMGNPEPIVMSPRDRDLPLSFAQERQWFFHKLEPDSGMYNLSLNTRLIGELNVEALVQSIQELVRRHESLRTRFVEGKDGMPVQVIEPSLTVELPLTDLRSLTEDERETEVRRLAQQEIETPFDLSRCPLFRVSLLQVGEQEFIVLATMHHIIFDEWSGTVFFKELAICYDAFLSGKSPQLPGLNLQYADFACWQRSRLEEGELQRQLAYWTQQLRGELPVLRLTSDRPRQSAQHFEGAIHLFRLSESLSRQLDTLSQQEGCTLFMTLLAAFNTLLHRYSGQVDIIIGSLIANRNRAELEQLIGFFANTVALRTDLSGDPSFRELLQRVRKVSLEAQHHQDIPFERIIAEIRPEREQNLQPVFQVMFALQEASTGQIQLSELTLETMPPEYKTSEFDLILDMATRKDGLHGILAYSTDLFDETTILRMLTHFETLLEGIVEHPERKLSQLPILPEAERRQILFEWNQTEAEYPTQRCLHELFEDQVARMPEARALLCGPTAMSYRELDRKASQCARYLRSLGLGSAQYVLVCMERSFDSVVAILGTLKAGAAYVPIDPSTPKERLAFIAEDTRAAVLLTQEALLDRLPATRPRTICLDRDWAQIGAQTSDTPEIEVSSESPSYVIYTSGSTGNPKGVLVSHKAVVNRCLSAIKNYRLSAEDRVLQFASLSFDVSVEELFPALFVGATVVLREQREVPTCEEFSQFIRNHRITVLNIPTAYWHEWVDRLSQDVLALPESLRMVIVGTEAALPEKLRKWQNLPGNTVSWINAYGPTETTITATIYDVEPGTEGTEVSLSRVPIGRPIDNTQIFLLDQAFQPVPIGVPGEIFIGGESLALGYLNQPELTADAFVSHPFDETSKARFYRTGDLGRYLPDGTLEFLGRLDDQVKIRGFRIEPGEIASRLKQHPLLCDAAVVFESKDDQMRLIGYLVLEQNRLRIRDEICSVYTVAQKPELQEEIEGVHTGSWPTFFLGDAVHVRYWKRLYEQFPSYQVAVVGQDGQVLAAIHALPISWNGTPADLPEGWDDAVIRGFEGHQQGIPANTLCILAGVVAEEAQGKGLSYELIKIMKSIAASEERFEHAIVPVRPTRKVNFPDMPLEAYCRKTREDGARFDPWLRVHERLGGTILGLNHESQLVTGSIAQWELWTGREFDRSGEYMVDGAMQPVMIDLERDMGRYYDLTVWFEHQAEPYQDLRFHDVQPRILQHFLAEFLPDYMIPSKFIVLSSIPMTPGGKIDRQALPAAVPSSAKTELTLPATSTEKRLAAIWSEVLDLEPPLGIHDNFFHLGGHSLLAIRLISKMSHAFQLKLSVKSLFLHPTIAELAKEIEELLHQTESVELAAEKNVKPAGEEGSTSFEDMIRCHTSPFLHIEQRPLLSLFATEQLAPVDAVALSYLESFSVEETGVGPELVFSKWFYGLPLLGGTLETPWGRIAHIVLPRLRSELYENLATLLDEVTDALKMAKLLGARAVSLTGLLPSATNYGRDIADTIAGRQDLPMVTTGHATTCAAVVLSIEEILQKSRRELAGEHVGFIGLGSIGLTTLRLMLKCLPHPLRITLCDVYAKRDALIELQAEIKEDLGFSGDVRIVTSTAANTLPVELYDATLIVGATNVPDILDVAEIQPGTLLVDDSGPHCFSPERALERFRESEDILFSEGGVLRSPQPISEIKYIPGGLENLLGADALESLLQHTPHHITGCVFSSLLSARFSHLSPTVGLVDSDTAFQHYKALVKLGFRAADLHFEGETLPESSVQNFCRRFAKQ